MILALLVLLSVALAAFTGQSYFRPEYLAFALLSLPFYKRFPTVFWGSAFLALLGLYFYWRQIPVTATAGDCQSVIELQDFPQKADPVGWRFPARLKSAACGLEAGAKVYLTDYRPTQVYDLEKLYVVRLRFSRENIYGQIQSAEALPAAQSRFDRVWRAKIATRIEALFAEQQRWIRALVLGDRSQLSAWDWRDLQRTGAAHLVAVSGLHLGIFAWFCYRFFLLLSLPLRWSIRPRSLALSASAACSLFYVLLTGAAPPVIRAALLFTVFVLHWHWPRLQTGMQALLLAAFFQCLWQPQTALQASAWLSYLAVATMILLHQRIQHWPFLGQYLAQSLMLACVLTPITWALFGGISWIAPFLNLLLVTWLPLLLLGLMLALLLPFLVPALDWLCYFYFSAIHTAAQWSWSYGEFLWQPHILSALGMSLMMLLALSQARWKRFFLLLCMLFVMGNSLRPAPEFLEIRHRFPVALIKQDADFYIINGGTRRSDDSRNDFKRFFLPVLRQHAVRPSALILTTDAVSAHNSIASILAAYPDTPIYSLVAQPKNFPFKTEICPQYAVPNLRFEKVGHACRLHLRDYMIEARKIYRRNS